MKKKKDTMKMHAMMNDAVIDFLKTTMIKKNPDINRTNIEDECKCRKL